MNLTTTQAAQLRNVNPSTIRRWCEMGKVKAQKAGRDWFIDQASLMTFIPQKVGRPAKMLCLNCSTRIIPVDGCCPECGNEEFGR